MTYTDDVNYWASRYAAVGWPQIITPYGQKSPQKKKGWQQDRPTVSDIAAATSVGPVNLGLLLGEPAGGLLGVDPDCEEMASACEDLLPPTACIMGREGKAKPIRYFYLVTGGDIPGPLTVKDPTTSGGDATIVDLLWTGKQTIVPPSTHPDGSHYTWRIFGPPAQVDAALIAFAVAKAAAAALLARHWPNGGRHDATLALAGGLLLAEWETEAVSEFVYAVATAAADEDIADRLRAVEDTAVRLAAGEDTVGFTRLADYLDPRIVKRVTDLLEIRAVKKAASAALVTALRCTDAGNAERLAAKFGNELRYVPELKKWLFWDGVRWVSETRRSIMTYAIDTVRSIHAEAALAETKDERTTLANWALESESLRRLSAICTIAQGLPELRASVNEFDADPFLLNAPNGVLDLRTFELAEHKSEDRLRLVTDAAYVPDSECPRFEQFILEIFGGDQQVADFVQRSLGMCLTGSVREEVFWLCHGDGSNGKTKLLNAIRAALGEYGATTPFDTFDADRQRGPSNDLAALKGKRFVTAVETDNERRLAEAKVKRVTGGDPVSCRYLYGEFFEYVPTYKLWLAINHKPIIRGTDQGIWRRVMLVPFLQTFEGSARDKDLEETLAAERVGILRWMVDGLRAYYEVGLDPPDSVKAAVDDYKTEMNTLADFVKENCEADPAATTATRDLYLRYTYWSKEFGERQLSHRAFSIQLRRLGLEPGVSNGVRFWRGVRLRPESFITATVSALTNGATDPESSTHSSVLWAK